MTLKELLQKINEVLKENELFIKYKEELLPLLRSDKTDKVFTNKVCSILLENDFYKKDTELLCYLIENEYPIEIILDIIKVIKKHSPNNKLIQDLAYKIEDDKG